MQNRSIKPVVKETTYFSSVVVKNVCAKLNKDGVEVSRVTGQQISKKDITAAVDAALR